MESLSLKWRVWEATFFYICMTAVKAWWQRSRHFQWDLSFPSTFYYNYHIITTWSWLEQKKLLTVTISTWSQNWYMKLQLQRCDFLHSVLDLDLKISFWIGKLVLVLVCSCSNLVYLEFFVCTYSYTNDRPPLISFLGIAFNPHYCYSFIQSFVSLFYYYTIIVTAKRLHRYSSIKSVSVQTKRMAIRHQINVSFR